MRRSKHDGLASSEGTKATKRGCELFRGFRTFYQLIPDVGLINNLTARPDLENYVAKS